MHFNDDELALVALSPSTKFSKEGILYTKPSVHAMKRSKSTKVRKGYVERWFCLKGNLLFCMKGIERTGEVGGVVVLERCSVELDTEETENHFSFVIGQAGSDDLIYLGCKTEVDREEWISSLHTASYECMNMQLENLREQLTLKTGQDPLTSPHSTTFMNSTLASEDEAPFIEMCLSCSQLRGSTDESPNTIIDILSLVPPTADWSLIGQTEIVEKSHNPLFMKTIGVTDQQRPTKMRIKLVIYDVRELVSRTRTQIGQATFILEDLLASKKLVQEIISPDRTQVGSVNVMSWSTSNPSDSSADLALSSECALDGSAAAWHGDKTYRTKKKDQLKFLFSNTVCKVFRFPTINNHELSVCELMSESRLSFVLPVNFMKFLLQDNNQWKDRINLLDSVETRSDRQKQLVVENLTQFSDYLSSSIHYLETKHSRQTFKASQQKGEKTLEVIPINLHIQRMLACNQYTQTGSSHDLFTVGAFAVHPRGFKHGGLARLLKSHLPDSQSFQLPNMSRLAQLLEATAELDSLRSAVANSCEDIHRACVTKDRDALATAHNLLKTKSAQLLEFSSKRPLVTESMISFHSSVIPASKDDDSSQSRYRLSQLNQSNDRFSHITQSNHASPPIGESDRRLPARSAPSQEAWSGTLSSAQKSISDLLETSNKCLEEAEPSRWLEMVSSDKMKCDAYVEKLYSLTSVGLAHSTIQQTSSSDPFIANVQLMIRYTAVRCQAVAAAVTGVLSKVRFSITDEDFLTQLSQIGCLLHFESLLSCHGSEMGMLEDFIIGVQSLNDVEFKFSESSSAQDDYLESPPVITGNRLSICVTMAVPSVAFRLLPESLRKGKAFKVVPVMFNIGINELATIAERVGSTALQERINKASYETLLDYYVAYQKLFGSVDSTLNSRYSVEELLIKLEQNVNDSKKKNVEILQLSAEVCRKLNCVRFTSCKSAKDRTAMSVTLEECRILQQEHQLSPHVFEKALSCLRSEGVRRQNSFKNAGVMSYAFSSFQLLSFPKLYKPPTGTYGKGET